MSEFRLQLKGIFKEFAGVKALDNVCFNLRPGEVHVLAGENGAGKSTLMKIIDGVYRPDQGEIWIDGQMTHISSPKEAISKGISMIHQELNMVPSMTVSENIFLGRELKRNGVIDKKTMQIESRKALDKLGINIDPNELINHLTVSQMQMIEIAKAVSYDSKIVIMDEPTSALSDKEASTLFKVIAVLKKNQIGIVYISHKMNEIYEIADSITVLRDGQVIDSRAAADLPRDKLIALMVGRELNNVYPQRSSHQTGEVVLQVDNLANKHHFKQISFSLRKGEILGIAGLMGAGRSEVLETIFGMRRASEGQIIVNGESRIFRNPNEAISKGLSLVTADRRRTGLNLKATIKHNMSIVALKKYCKWNTMIQHKTESKVVDDGIQNISVKCSSRDQMIENLSGGNQQKVIFARWLLEDPQILMLDEPTRGIDIGAKQEIYSIIRRLADEGRAVLVVSSELPEIIGISDRVLVMHEGTITGELSKEEMTQEKIMTLAVGVKEEVS